MSKCANRQFSRRAVRNSKITPHKRVAPSRPTDQACNRWNCACTAGVGAATRSSVIAGSTARCETSVKPIMSSASRCAGLHALAAASVSCASHNEATRYTSPQASPTQCSFHSDWLMMAPPNRRSATNFKMLGASTAVKKIMPPSQTASASSKRNLRKVLRNDPLAEDDFAESQIAVLRASPVFVFFPAHRHCSQHSSVRHCQGLLLRCVREALYRHARSRLATHRPDWRQK